MDTKKHQKANVAIVGAGPLGIELAIALKRIGISYLQFDKGQIAQMIFNFPPETPFFSSSEKISLAGIPIQTVNQQKCTREAYLAYIRSLVMAYDLTVNTYEEVETIAPRAPHGFRLSTRSNAGEGTYDVRFVVIATGGTSRPRLLGVPGEGQKHIFSSMGDPHRYFKKQLLIIGGRNSAAEDALRCYHAGAHVSLAIRGPQWDPNHVKYWILPELLGLIARTEITCYYNSEVAEILPASVLLRDAKSGEVVDVAVDFVLKAIGFEADMELLARLGVGLTEEQQCPLCDDKTMETAVNGVYVLGTVVGGTQKKYNVFIENTHAHVDRIVNALCDRLGIKGGLRMANQEAPHISEPSKQLEE